MAQIARRCMGSVVGPGSRGRRAVLVGVRVRLVMSITLSVCKGEKWRGVGRGTPAWGGRFLYIFICACLFGSGGKGGEEMYIWLFMKMVVGICIYIHSMDILVHTSALETEDFATHSTGTIHVHRFTWLACPVARRPYSPALSLWFACTPLSRI